MTSPTHRHILRGFLRKALPSLPAIAASLVWEVAALGAEAAHFNQSVLPIPSEKEGVRRQRHWSFTPPRRPDLPPVTRPASVRNPIDAFILSRLEREGLTPSPEATKETLIRRVTLDLTGLPPSLDEVDAFVADGSPDAYEKLVDRVLRSPTYGERWAQVWLDFARYADSAGYAQDPPRVIWRYRDWVIDALNRNLPFDQFTIEQLAGDLLPEPTEDQLIATAFHRNTMTNSEGGTDDEEFRVAAVVDRVNTTMQVWMGVTMGCAQCHDHKYDPITQEEYYRFFAFVNNTEDSDKQDERPTLKTFNEDQERERAALEEKISRLKRSLDDAASSAKDHDPEREASRRRLAELEKELSEIKPVTTPILRELPPQKRRDTYIHVRGNFLVKGERVSPGVPAAFHPLPDDVEKNRLALARWLVDDGNPLTARVLVNRCWEKLFGTGLVETSEDFGRQGELPSHPELLDYLATELLRLGWNTKALVREIVTSATYRQSSRVTSELSKRDPFNRLLTRGSRFRLSAETIRDQALFVGGLLSSKMHGPSVRPPRPVLGLKAAFGSSTDWKTSPGEDRYRRGLYTRWRRTTPYPSMTTFDSPSREFCTGRRIRTNTPLQALVTLNDPVFVEAAQGLARRLLSTEGKRLESRIVYGFRLTLARRPGGEELRLLKKLHDESLERFRRDSERAEQMATDPLGPVPAGMDVAELAAWTVVANVLLNLDEAIMKR